MRKLFLPLLGAAGLSAFIAGAALRHESAPPASAAAAELPLPAPEKASPAAEAPPAAASSPAPTAAEAPPAPSAAAEAPTAALPSRAASDLPTVEVATHTIHAVPEEDAPMLPVTVKGRDGRVLATLHPPSARPPQPAPAAPPVNGAARVVDDTVLDVLGRSVRLFGVRPPAPRDRCALSSGAAPRPCREVAREVLAQRLAGRPDVHCRIPPGQRGAAGAVCLDGRGTDLGGFLVAEGLALADSTESYDYVGAESVARSFHRGLWHYR